MAQLTLEQACKYAKTGYAVSDALSQDVLIDGTDDWLYTTKLTLTLKEFDMLIERVGDVGAANVLYMINKRLIKELI